MRRPAVVASLAAVLAAGACVERVPLPADDRLIEFSRSLTFYETPIEIHFSKPAQLDPGAPLLLYATGDGGWRGPDRDVYEHMIHWGYPVAGYSALTYIKHIGYVSGTTTPERLARDYVRLIAFAKSSLGLPERTPTILVGVSRGAGLSVVAASEDEVRQHVEGVMAVALIQEEEYVRHYRVRRGQARGDTPSRELVTFDNYASLELLTSLPVAVIQSTGDGYLPAADARRLFGPDSALRRFTAVDARNHSFKGGRRTLFEEMVGSLKWIRARRASPPWPGSRGQRRPPPPGVTSRSGEPVE